MPSKPPAVFLALAVLLAFAAGAAGAATRYIAFGDSVTAAWGFDEACDCNPEDPAEADNCKHLCGYSFRLKTRLRDDGLDVAILNRGLGGERTPDGLERLDEVLAAADGDVLLLMEGTNDVSVNISPETTEENLREMARKASLVGVETIHATLIPRFPEAKVDADNVANAAMAQHIREFTFETGRQLVDPFEVFSSTPNLFEEYYADGEGDPVGHPNARGFDLLTDAFYDVLTGADNVPPVLGFYEPADGAAEIGPFSPVRVNLYDFGIGIDASATRMRINGEEVATTGSGGEAWLELLYEPATPHPAEVTVSVESRDLNLNAMAQRVTTFTIDQDAPGPCFADETTLCLDDEPGDERFKVTMTFKTAQGGGSEGDAVPRPLAPIGLRRGALFSFFDVQNPEVLLKILNGCGLNERFWVFVAPTTTVGYELRIVDTVAAQLGAKRSEYEVVVKNKDGVDAPPFSSTSAFATCGYQLTAAGPAEPPRERPLP